MTTRYRCRNWRADRLTASRIGGSPMRSQACELLARRADHPGPDRQDHPGVFEHTDEAVRWHQAVTRALPAQQRLDARDLAAAQLGLGLEMQHELLALDRTAEVAFERHARRDRRSQVVAEETVRCLDRATWNGTSPYRYGESRCRYRHRRSGTSKCRCWPRSRSPGRPMTNGDVRASSMRRAMCAASSALPMRSAITVNSSPPRRESVDGASSNWLRRPSP